MARKRKGLIRGSVLSALAAFAFTGVGVLATPVHAYEPWIVRTSDDNPGGKAAYVDPGDEFTVCDTDKDGYRAVGWLYGNRLDASGGSGTCKERRFNFIEGMNLKMEVCLMKGAKGAKKFCRYTWVRA